MIFPRSARSRIASERCSSWTSPRRPVICRSRRRSRTRVLGLLQMAARRHRRCCRLLEPGAPAAVVARFRGLVLLRAWIPQLRQPAAAPGRCAALHPRQSCARFDLRAGGCAGLSGRLRRARRSGARPGHDDGDAGATGSPADSIPHAGRSGAAWWERLRSIAARASDRRCDGATRSAGMERPGTHPFQLPRLQLAPGRRSGH